MPKILITGSKSFVGTNFRKFSKFKNIEEISLYDIRPENIDFSNFDVVLHLAAIVHQTRNISESEYMKVNRDLCLKVAESAKRGGVGQFIFLSSLKVYGDSKLFTEIRNEESECLPVDPYGKSKYGAEVNLKKLEDTDFTVSIIRPPLIYGEGVKANMLSLIKLVDKFPILPFDAIQNKRNYLYIENLIGYIDRIIDRKASGIFIVKDKNALSTTELVNYLSKNLGRKLILFKMPGFFKKIGTYLFPLVFDRLFGSSEFDNSKTNQQLDYKPQISTEDGIRNSVMSYRSREKS